MPKAEDYLYPNQMIVEIDDYDGLQAELDRLRAEVARLHERLEDNHWFKQDASGNMVRVECDPGSIPDGISCRDETIKLQDESNDRLRAEKAYIIRRLMSAVDQSNWDEDLKGERFKGFEEAMELIHEMIMDFLPAKANETEGK